MTRAIVWSKKYCPYCIKAKDLLDSKGISYEERNIMGQQWTREDLLESVPNAKSVPQVFLDGKLIGTYDQLKAYFDNQ